MHHFLRPNTTCAKKDRAAQGQRRLTSYTDPYVGFLVIDDRPFIVRERSPYKESFDVGTLKNQRVFNEFIEQIAIATATAVSMMSARRRHLCLCFVLRFVHNEFTQPPPPPPSFFHALLAYERHGLKVARPVQARDQTSLGGSAQERSLEQGERKKERTSFRTLLPMNFLASN